jgi:hypothetical protein
MMKKLIELGLHADDEQVKSLCLVAVLDRAGARAIDFDLAEEKTSRPAFDPRNYTAEELRVIESVLKLVQAREQEKTLHAPIGPE